LSSPSETGGEFFCQFACLLRKVGWRWQREVPGILRVMDELARAVVLLRPGLPWTSEDESSWRKKWLRAPSSVIANLQIRNILWRAEQGSGHRAQSKGLRAQGTGHPPKL